MATILLIGSDQTNQENLASTLRARGHSVMTADWSRLQSADWNTRMSAAEIAMFDVTQLDEDSRRQLRRICQWPRQDGFPILVLCYSRAYRGPRFELDIERMGARFVYAE
jgi:DNA-binding response OmpR family regulator